jgi:hypothetical protein
MKNLTDKFKDETFLKRLKDSGVNIDSLKKSIKEKINSKTVTK